MGFLDDLLGGDKKNYKEKPAPYPSGIKDVKGPISMSIRFLPVRLAARKDNKIDMIVKISNESGERQLVSFEANAPKGQMIGFDPTVVSKHYEKKVGTLEAGAGTEFAVTLYGTSQTKAGSYDIDVAGYVHFVDYTKVINYVKRKVSLRVV